jgi:SSS family solute:Na+ symporter/sodium/pantothenate symporter
MVRQMADRDTVVLRRSILFVGIFFTLIYLPLVLVFTSARILLPGMEITPDRIMPEMASLVTSNAGVPWLAGILVAAPFAAVMSSVDSFLLLVSSGVVRDVYQQNAKHDVSEKTIARLSYWTTLCVGFLAVLFVLNPPEFLQTLIVFASGGLGACFLVPVVLALYWRRMTANAAVAGMIIGGAIMLLFYLIGWKVNGEFSAFSPFNIHPFIWASSANLLVLVVITLLGRKPDQELVERYFGT